MQDTHILIIDIETTCLTPSTGKIVEIGMVDLDIMTGERKLIFNQVCWETGITKDEVEKSWIVQHSTLTVDDIRKSKNLNLLKDEIQGLIRLYPKGATAFNNPFDFGFLESRGFSFPKKLGDPMLISKNIVKALNKHAQIKNPSVEECYRFYFNKPDYVEAHRGGQDAMDEAEIVWAMRQRGLFNLNDGNDFPVIRD